MGRAMWIQIAPSNFFLIVGALISLSYELNFFSLSFSPPFFGVSPQLLEASTLGHLAPTSLSSYFPLGFLMSWAIEFCCPIPIFTPPKNSHIFFFSLLSLGMLELCNRMSVKEIHSCLLVECIRVNRTTCANKATCGTLHSTFKTNNLVVCLFTSSVGGD